VKVYFDHYNSGYEKCFTLFSTITRLMVIHDIFFDNFIPLETGMNTLWIRHKQCHFNHMKFPLYLVKLKIAQNGRPLTAVRSVEPIVPNFCRKLFSVPFVLFQLVRKFFRQSSGRKFLHSHGVLSEFFSSNSICLSLACELKLGLKCHDLRRVTVMTSSSKYVHYTVL